MNSNVFKTALLFEGGSMRASYTCAVAAYFLEQGLYFDNVYGVSAGSSNTVNYISRDIKRTIDSFTTFITLPKIGNVGTMLAHKGYFNAHYIYQEAGLPDGVLPFDYETFKANPAKCTVVAVERDTGRDLYFTKDQMTDIESLMVRVRASSTLPVFMPPPKVNGMYCYDGGFAAGGGLPLQRIKDDGFDRVVVIRTRPREYRKTDTASWAKTVFWKRPEMRAAVLGRTAQYNASCDLLAKMEEAGEAYVFYAEDIQVSGAERSYDKLMQSFESGYAQIKRDFGKITDFIARNE